MQSLSCWTVSFGADPIDQYLSLAGMPWEQVPESLPGCTNLHPPWMPLWVPCADETQVPAFFPGVLSADSRQKMGSPKGSDCPARFSWSLKEEACFQFPALPACSTITVSPKSPHLGLYVFHRDRWCLLLILLVSHSPSVGNVRPLENMLLRACKHIYNLCEMFWCRHDRTPPPHLSSKEIEAMSTWKIFLFLPQSNSQTLPAVWTLVSYIRIHVFPSGWQLQVSL